MNGALLLVLPVLLLVAGLALLWWSRRTRAGTGVPAGAVVYSDTGAEKSVAEPLLSHRLGIVGKPDYLVEITANGRRLTVPMEVKSRKRPPEPAASHVLQLATYCLLVEDVMGQRPPYGLLRYSDATLTIPFTDDLRRQVLAAAEAIRRSRTAVDVARSHQDATRCRNCGYQQECGAVLR